MFDSMAWPAGLRPLHGIELAVRFAVTWCGGPENGTIVPGVRVGIPGRNLHDIWQSAWPYIIAPATILTSLVWLSWRQGWKFLYIVAVKIGTTTSESSI